MNNHENHTSSTNQFVIDTNPLNSEAVRIMLTGEDVHKPVGRYIDRFMSNVTLNILDIPFILMALDVITQSIKTHCDEKDAEIYNKLKAHSQVITFHDHSNIEEGDEDND